ncbi:MAG: bifunctional folylpolyglutamate synthase/dihydrofolate synthase, partial [Pseudomonadota bacterium]
AYTSPHLARFHERIRISGALIEEPALADVLAECEEVNGGAPITYFEITTAAAFLAFSRAQADYTLLEVGLGGRVDATNVIDAPALCVITPISLDHQAFLGDTVAEIAAEKAGILKRDVTCVVTEQTDAAMAVIEARANAVGAPLLIQNRDWQAWEERGRLVYQDAFGLGDLPLPNLIGAHQITNAGAALCSLRQLGRGNMDAAVTQAHWPARLQRLREGPLVDQAGTVELWLDGGHNPAAAKALAEALGRLPARPTRMVAGLLKTKDARGYFSGLGAAVERVEAVSIPGESATFTAQETTDAARAAGLRAAPHAGLEEALAAALADGLAGRVIIAGSLYLAGAVLRDHG